MVVNVKPHTNFAAIYWITVEGGTTKLGTKNMVVGSSVYGERLFKFKGEEYRLWDPFRSKLAAAILNGLETVPVWPSQKVLYLGAASGTTASHISDIVGEEGQVYCVEFASRSLRELVDKVCTFRHNMSPVLADARSPVSYSHLIEQVDCIYCDVAQPEQARLLADNADMFLADWGWVLLAIKAQSIDVTKKPSVVFEDEVATLESRDFYIKQIVGLEPFDKAHAMVVAQKK